MRKYYGVDSGGKANFYLDRILADDSRVIQLCNTAGTKVLLSGIMANQDFSVQIANSWNNASGLSIIDTVVGMANGMIRSSAGQMLADKLNSGEGLIGSLGNMLNSAVGSNVTGKLKKLQNMVAVNATNMVKQYQGTKASLSIPDMNIIFLVSKDGDSDPRSFITRNVDGQLIYKLMGFFRAGDNISVEEYTLLAMQSPPNDYEVDYKNLFGDEVTKGTFTLKLGKTVTLKNVVISNVTINKSPYRSASLSGDIESDDAELTPKDFPAYVVVTISFEFCKELLPDQMVKIISKS